MPERDAREPDEPVDPVDAGLSRRELLAAGLGLSGAMLIPKALRGQVPANRFIR